MGLTRYSWSLAQQSCDWQSVGKEWGEVDGDREVHVLLSDWQMHFSASVTLLGDWVCQSTFLTTTGGPGSPHLPPTPWVDQTPIRSGGR